MTGALAATGRSPAPDALIRFLTRFSIALHKHATYPPGHPTLVSADSAVAQALDGLFQDRTSLQLGVARRELIIDGQPIESSNAIVSELAERLHRREIGGLELRRGITPDELADLLQEMSADPQVFRQRLHGEGEPLPAWPHVQVAPHAFRRLALASEQDVQGDDDSGAERLWASLAAAALDRAVGDGGGSVEPTAIAARINTLVKDETSGRKVAEMLVRLGRHARGAGHAERVAVEGKVRSLVSGLSKEALSWLFQGQSPDERRALLGDAVDALPVDTVVELLEAAASSGSQNISHYMLRLLKKLANQASTEGETGFQGDVALRDAAHEMIDNWTLEDPNPAQHTRLLEEVSRFEHSKLEGQAPLTGEGLRLMQIALETDASGDHVLEAAELMLESRQLGELLDLLGGAVDAPNTVGAVRRHLMSPEILRRVLLEEPIDVEGSQRLLGEVGPDGAGGLLDALTISEAQATRRLIVERLAAMGAAIGPLLAERMPRAPWYVQRNLLALLARLKELPPGFTARPWAEHPEVTVRFQALSVMARQANEREEAVHLALGDTDPRVIRFGLDAAAGAGLPRSALTRLMLLLNNPARPVELRARGIRLLGQVHNQATRDWLIDRVLTKRTLFRGPRLMPRSPEMIASLAVLARKWREYPPAAWALKTAAESGDPDLAMAATGQEPG